MGGGDHFAGLGSQRDQEVVDLLEVGFRHGEGFSSNGERREMITLSRSAGQLDTVCRRLGVQVSLEEHEMNVAECNRYGFTALVDRQS